MSSEPALGAICLAISQHRIARHAFIAAHERPNVPDVTERAPTPTNSAQYASGAERSDAWLRAIVLNAASNPACTG